MKDSHNIDHNDDILFQIGFLNKHVKDTYNSSVEHPILVTAKYCERHEICLMLENNMKPMHTRKIETDLYKPFFQKLLSFQIENQSLLVYYQTARSMCMVVVCLTAPDLENYDFVIALAHPSSAVSLKTHDRHVMASDSVYEEPQTLWNEDTSANFDLDSEYRGSCVNFSIHDAMAFRRIVIEFEVFADVRQPYNATLEKNIVEVGLASKDFIDKKTVLRYSKESVSIELTLEPSNTCEKNWHLYSWNNGNLSENITVTERYPPLRILFDVDTKSKIVRVSLYRNCRTGFQNFAVLESVEFDRALYPCAGIETTLFPIKIFYKVKYMYI